MNNYLFEITDEESELCGEEFFVQADTKKDAWGIVFDNFGTDLRIKYLGKYSDEEAEAMGYDTY